MDRVDCTLISSNVARKLAQSCITGQLPERMSQVASTGLQSAKLRGGTSSFLAESLSPFARSLSRKNRRTIWRFSISPVAWSLFGSLGYSDRLLVWLLNRLNVQPSPDELISLNTHQGHSPYSVLLPIGLCPMIVQFGPYGVSFFHFAQDLYLYVGVFAYPPETVYSFRGDMQKPPK